MSVQFSRRSVMLAATAGIAVSAAIPAKAGEGSFSPEYWSCYRRRIDLERFHAIDGDESEAFYAIIKTADDAFRAAKEALVQRGVAGLLDIIAFLRVDYWHSGHFVQPQGYVDRDHERMLRAAEKLAGVESWDVPNDLVRLVAEKEAREAARRAEWEAERERRLGLLRINLDRPNRCITLDNFDGEYLNEILTPENVSLG